MAIKPNRYGDKTMRTLQAIYFGQKHPSFDHNHYEILNKVKRLGKKHQRQCENSYNGYGVVNGNVYYNGSIDDYAKRHYGFSVKSAYVTKADIDDGCTVVDLELDKIQDKINDLIYNTPFKVEYQHDPRGNTIKLYYENDYIRI